MGNFTKKYISVDVETSGAYPWNSSMLSLGACEVGNTDNIFYAELKPINKEYLADAMRVGCRGLKSLENLQGFEKYNTLSDNFDSKATLDILSEKGEDPQKVMTEFSKWVRTSTKGYKPILAAAPIIFDGPFINYYLDKFCNEENPFGHSGEDINSMFRGKAGDITAGIKELSLREKMQLKHNALDDAVQQAKEFYTILVFMRQHNF